MTTTVDTLRRAAALMRKRARPMAHGAPWVDGQGSVLRARHPEGVPIATGMGMLSSAHIASWHPGVALAVADWLDAVAGYGKDGDEASIHYDTCAASLTPENECSCPVEDAHHLAWTYLRENT